MSGSAGKFAHAFHGQAAEAVTELSRMRADSARFNLGNIYRDFNDPTLALQFLNSRNRARFQFAWSTTADSSRNGRVEVNFIEREHPTLLSAPGGDLAVTGSFVLQAGDGTVVQSRVNVIDTPSGTRAEIVVRYRQDTKLGRGVPVRMQESYQQILSEDGPLSQQLITEQRIDCVASYSNFRRFETSGRVLLPR